jgi:hypothetical protein
MNNRIILRVLSIALLGMTSLGIGMVSLMAFVNPQSVMDMVGVSLPNTDAYSSIRGVYGGAGMAIFVALVYLLIYNQKLGLLFVALLCGLYALSRIITIYAEGSLGDFGQQWLMIESSMCVMALLVYYLRAMAERLVLQKV